MHDKFSYKNLCGSCNQKPCCSDFSAPPILFTGDLEKLKEIGKSNNHFVEELIIKSKPFKTIRKKGNSNACIFWDEKTNFCSIYEHRPYDCRMFPFDIEWINNEYRWIVYSCNPNSDWAWCEQHLEKLESDPQFDEIMKNVEFFRLASNDYVDESKEPTYVVLRQVKWNDQE